jgi:hypothetical protein
METPVTRSAQREALHALVDYAGLFPPAKLPLAEAIAEYRAARSGAFSWMLGRFIVALPLLSEHADALRDAPLCAILDGGSAATGEIARLRAAGLRIEVLEVPLAVRSAGYDAALAAMHDLQEALAHQGLSDLPTYVELPRDEGWKDLLPRAMRALAELGLRAKLRCGGLVESAFPSVDDVAAFIAASCASGVPFKATAGLHHPIRHVDPATGFPMHGFLNLLVATAIAPNADGPTLLRAIGEEEAAAFSLTPEGLRWRDRVIDPDTLAQSRRERFVSYGSCSFAEPVDDLIALGMLAR